ncbi:helix-turn-helix transcriptional regulator [Ruegeria marisrubri]|nr:helix-turn-helix transcriptional regulator [Ruegeria marisrubri]
MALMIVVQALCAVFFIGDVLLDATEGSADSRWHLAFETVAAIVLCIGTLYFMVELRRLWVRMAQVNAGLRAARGEMFQVIDAFFASWGLTPAERDVALLILKGLDNESIAQIRGTAAGTVRAQSAAIYAKANVDGRAQLLSLFMEELLAGDSGDSDPSEQFKPSVAARSAR